MGSARPDLRTTRLLLYDHLTALGVRVWLDSRCLKQGKRWEDGFLDGLLGAAVLVPIRSKPALSRFAGLNAKSCCDNVLLDSSGIRICTMRKCMQGSSIFLGINRNEMSLYSRIQTPKILDDPQAAFPVP